MIRTLSLRYVAPLALIVPFTLFGAACSDDGGSGGSTVPDAGASGDSAVSGDGATTSDGSPAVDGAPVGDITPPTVVSNEPASAATGEPTTATISATFSEAMAPLTINATSFTVTQGTVAVPGTVTFAGDTAIFAPTSELALNTVYTVTISTAATDVAGNPLAAPYSWTFTTDPAVRVGPAPVALGLAGKYVVLAESAITNVPTSAITGDVGLSPAAASFITGFALTKAGTRWTSPQVVGSLFAADNDPPTPITLTTAVANMHTAYTDAAGRPTPTQLNLGAGTLSGVTLTPGLYRWTTGVTIPADITISGAKNDVWIFQISGDLTIAADKKMLLSGAAQPKNIIWQVTGAANFGTTSHAEGIVLAKTAITLGAGASVNGRLYAQTAVNLASNKVTRPAP